MSDVAVQGPYMKVQDLGIWNLPPLCQSPLSQGQANRFHLQVVYMPPLLCCAPVPPSSPALPDCTPA
ncbi:unnamed protein product [Merluccius merluccius]